MPEICPETKSNQKVLHLLNSLNSNISYLHILPRQEHVCHVRWRMYTKGRKKDKCTQSGFHLQLTSTSKKNLTLHKIIIIIFAKVFVFHALSMQIRKSTKTKQIRKSTKSKDDICFDDCWAKTRKLLAPATRWSWFSALLQSWPQPAAVKTHSQTTPQPQPPTPPPPPTLPPN